MSHPDYFGPAPASKLPKACRYCNSTATAWIEQAPGYWHRIRVNCRNCQRFNKWANEAQLQEAGEQKLDLMFVPYTPPRTLEEALWDERSESS